MSPKKRTDARAAEGAAALGYRSAIDSVARTADTGQQGPARPPESVQELRTLRRIPVRHWGRYVGGAVVALCLAWAVVSVARNPRVGWPVIGHYLFSPVVFSGLKVTLYLTAVSLLIGFVGGTLLCLMSMSDNPVFRFVAGLYVLVIRGTPILVQIIFWGFLGALYPNLVLGIPFTHVVFASASTDHVLGAVLAAVFALSFNEAAYASEIVRGGLLGVEKGQREAAMALGLTPARTMRRIVVPQAMRMVIPPFGNQVIMMLKTTSLVSVIGGRDLMTNIQIVYAQNYQVIPLLVVAGIWYIFLTTLLGFPQRWLERRYGRGQQ